MRASKEPAAGETSNVLGAPEETQTLDESKLFQDARQNRPQQGGYFESGKEPAHGEPRSTQKATNRVRDQSLINWSNTAFVGSEGSEYSILGRP
ncbi:hypothetical protein VTN77DRAFT_9870 [Rasamsonia byssochlamydoides]|uniref:uncharacterized protein n=1 Tax=Rasamsonia byssochlamydoides TaxID=89139 RepID=UPI00374471E4